MCYWASLHIMCKSRSSYGTASTFKTWLTYLYISSFAITILSPLNNWTKNPWVTLAFLAAFKDQQPISGLALHTWLGQEWRAQIPRALLCQHSQDFQREETLHSTWKYLFRSISILWYNICLLPGEKPGHKEQTESSGEAECPERWRSLSCHLCCHSHRPRQAHPHTQLDFVNQILKATFVDLCSALACEQTHLPASTLAYFCHGELFLHITSHFQMLGCSSSFWRLSFWLSVLLREVQSRKPHLTSPTCAS